MPFISSGMNITVAHTNTLASILTSSSFPTALLSMFKGFKSSVAADVPYALTVVVAIMFVITISSIHFSLMVLFI
jgi:hypothetical protein